MLYYSQCTIFQPPLEDTVLHLASRRKDSEMVKLFIEGGVTVDKGNAEGQTALHLAALHGDEATLR